MTSLYAPTSLYTVQKPTFCTEKTYAENSIMDYIWKNSPIFAQCIQTACLEDMFNSLDFNGTCFVPCKLYSDAHLDNFIDNLTIQTARRIVTTNCLKERVDFKALSNSESIPTLDRYTFINIMGCKKGMLRLNEHTSILKPDILLNNGIVHITNGFIAPPTFWR